MSGDADQRAALKRQAQVLWEEDRATLLLAQPFLAHLAMQLTIVPVIDARLATAATDGRSVFVSAPFLLGLTPADRLFVLAHEVWHCALGHFARQGSRGIARWNIAIDHEVNAMIRADIGHMPAGAVYFPAWEGLCAEEVYERLPPSAGLAADGGRGPLADCHSRPDGDGSAPGDPDLTFTMGGFEEWPLRVMTAARQMERNGGRLPGGAAMLVERLSRPSLGWRDLIARFVARSRRCERRWDRPDRRFVGRGLYLPGRTASAHRLVVAIDVSGSTLACLPRFLGELAGILTSGTIDTVRVLACDAAIQLDTVLAAGDIASGAGLSLRGGGGTDFRPVFAHLQTRDATPDGVIVLTDGFGRAPEKAPGYPVLWALTSHGQRPAEWADCIRLPASPPSHG